MEGNKKFRVLIIAGILGVLYTIFLLYKRRGYLINTDWFSILFVGIFASGLIYYFKKKSEK